MAPKLKINREEFNKLYWLGKANGIPPYILQYRYLKARGVTKDNFWELKADRFMSRNDFRSAEHAGHLWGEPMAKNPGRKVSKKRSLSQSISAKFKRSYILRTVPEAERKVFETDKHSFSVSPVVSGWNLTKDGKKFGSPSSASSPFALISQVQKSLKGMKRVDQKDIDEFRPSSSNPLGAELLIINPPDASGNWKFKDLAINQEFRFPGRNEVLIKTGGKTYGDSEHNHKTVRSVNATVYVFPSVNPRRKSRMKLRIRRANKRRGRKPRRILYHGKRYYFIQLLRKFGKAKAKTIWRSKVKAKASVGTRHSTRKALGGGSWKTLVKKHGVMGASIIRRRRSRR
jgi:hypothetical protein